jgi:hypothetical protein
MTFKPVEKSSTEWSANKGLDAMFEYRSVSEEQKGIWLLQQREAIIDVQKKVLALFKDETDGSPDLQIDRTFAKE